MIADAETARKLAHWEQVRSTFLVNQNETESREAYQKACSDFEGAYFNMLQDLRSRAQQDRYQLIEVASEQLAAGTRMITDEDACAGAVRIARLLIATVDAP